MARKKTNQSIALTLIFSLFAVGMLYASSVSEMQVPATFSNTIPQFYRWLSPQSVRIDSTKRYKLWIEAPAGYKVQAVNESTGQYAGVVTYGSRTEQQFDIPQGTYTFLVDSSDRSGTFRCGIDNV